MEAIRGSHVASLVACVLVLCALTASPATAVEFRSDAYPATVTGSTKGAEFFTLSFGAESAACETASFSGTMEEPVESLALHPEFEGSCAAFGLAGATIATAGCDFVLNADEEEGPDAFIGSLDISCESEKAIEVSAGTCALKIENQNGIPGLSLFNTEAGGIDVQFAPASPLLYTVTKDGLFCPLPKTGEYENGSIEGFVPLQGNNGNLTLE